MGHLAPLRWLAIWFVCAAGWESDKTLPAGIILATAAFRAPPVGVGQNQRPGQFVHKVIKLSAIVASVVR